MPGPGFRPKGQATGGHCRSTPVEYQPGVGRAGRAAATPFYKVKYDPELHRERELAQDHTKCGLGMRGSGQSGCAGGPAVGGGGSAHSCRLSILLVGTAPAPAAVMGISCHHRLCPLQPPRSPLHPASEPTPLSYVASCQQDSLSRSFWASVARQLTACGGAGEHSDI